MIKRLSPHGNSLALVIDKGILKLLNIDRETPLEISTDGRALIIAPVQDKRRKPFKQAMDWSHRKFGRTFKKLAGS